MVFQMFKFLYSLMSFDFCYLQVFIFFQWIFFIRLIGTNGKGTCMGCKKLNGWDVQHSPGILVTSIVECLLLWLIFISHVEFMFTDFHKELHHHHVTHCCISDFFTTVVRVEAKLCLSKICAGFYLFGIILWFMESICHFFQWIRTQTLTYSNVQYSQGLAWGTEYGPFISIENSLTVWKNFAEYYVYCK